MTSDRKKSGVAFWATVTVVAATALVGYVAAYASLVKPVLFLGYGTWIEPVPPDVLTSYGRELNCSFVHHFFGPANWLDRHLIRPAFWRPEGQLKSEDPTGRYRRTEVGP
jgi:hypothetical protein